MITRTFIINLNFPLFYLISFINISIIDIAFYRFFFFSFLSDGSSQSEVAILGPKEIKHSLLRLEIKSKFIKKNPTKNKQMQIVKMIETFYCS